jgi:hypothetical protein
LQVVVAVEQQLYQEVLLPVGVVLVDLEPQQEQVVEVLQQNQN